MELKQIRPRHHRTGAATAAAITVIMPAYNCRRFIDRSLPPLLEMRRRGDVCEVIVVDDGSTDDTAEVAASLGARVIANGGRCGPGAARNLGARYAQGGILWFVDADVVARSDAVQHIRRALVDQDYVAVFGSYDDAPPARNFLSQYKNLVHHYYHQNGRSEASTFWAGCGAVRKSAFLSAGGFDALHYPRSSIEDIELGYRLRAGGRIRLAAELQGTHLKVWTLRGLLTTELRDRALPWAFLLLRRGHTGNELNIAVTERIRALIACIFGVSIVSSAIGLTPWWVPAVFLAMAFAANLELLSLFQSRKGWLFALGGLLFHQFYYLYSTAAYSWCWILINSQKLIGGVPRAETWSYWTIATAALAVLFAMLFLRWHVIDKAPPQWDQALYLLDATGEFDAAKSGGFIKFYEVFLTTNPGKGGLLALLAQPGFWIFGPYPDAAILPFALLWLLAVWGLYDFTSKLGRHVFALSDGAAAAAGFFAALLFAIYPVTQWESNTFLTEFPLITSVILVHAASLRYFLTGRLLWALATGFAIAFGLLAKVTFPALVLLPAVLVMWRWLTVAARRETAWALASLAGPPLAIVGPFYVRNIHDIIATTEFLSSARLAQIYGGGSPAWDLESSLKFIAAMLHKYEFLLLILLALLAFCVYGARHKSRAAWFALALLGFVVPFAIVALSNFKTERYSYPGYAPLFALAGLGMSVLWRWPVLIAAPLTMLLLFVPGLTAGVTYNVRPPRVLSLLAPLQSAVGLNGSVAPFLVDTRDWKASELVDFVEQRAIKGPVFLLGGSPAFQPALLRFVDQLKHRDRIYRTFDLDTLRSATVNDFIAAVQKVSPAAILYKTPPYEPNILGIGAKDTLDALVQAGAYRSFDVPVEQPDGSHFILLVPKTASVEVLNPRASSSSR